MSRIFLIFILLTLWKISFSTDILIPFLLKKENPTIAQKFKLQQHLIYPSANMFKSFILPYLTTATLIKNYFNLKNIYPNLEFEKFLPYETIWPTGNIILNLEGSNFLYELEGGLKPILYISKTKTPYIVENFTFQISPTSRFACFFDGDLHELNSNSVELHKLKPRFLKNGQQILALWNNNGLGNLEFYAAFKTTDNMIKTLAYGKSFGMKFDDLLECTWKAYNLSFCKKMFLKIIYFLQIVCLQYSKYITFLNSIFFFSGVGFMIDPIRSNNINPFKRLFWFVFYSLYGLFIILRYVYLPLIILPPYVLSTPIIFYTKTYLNLTFSGVITGCTLSLYPLVFPQSMKIFASGAFGGRAEHIVNTVKQGTQWASESFKIKPQTNNTWAIPVLVKRNSHVLLFFFILIQLMTFIGSITFTSIFQQVIGEN